MKITKYARTKDDTIKKVLQEEFCNVGKYRYYCVHYATFIKVNRIEKKLLGTTAALDSKELVAIIHL